MLAKRTSSSISCSAYLLINTFSRLTGFIYIYIYIFFFFTIFIYLFIYFWLCWVFVSVQGLSLVAASGGHSSSRCTGLSLSQPLLLRSTGSRRTGSVVVAHGPSCSVACGIFPDQSSNPCPLHWQADSQPLHHQGSPYIFLINLKILFHCLLIFIVSGEKPAFLFYLLYLMCIFPLALFMLCLTLAFSNLI